MEINVRGLVKTPVIEEIPHSILNKANNTDISIKDKVKLRLDSAAYSFFLRCLDLNINFTDELQHKH